MSGIKITSPSGEYHLFDSGYLRGPGTVAPKTQLHIKMDEPVQYETTMTENKEEIEKVKAQIKVLEKKLSFLEELEKTKSPVEEAYKRWMGNYPPTGPSVDGIDDIRWRAFQMGYNASKEDKVKMSESLHAGYYLAQKEKVKEWEPTPQTPEQVADGLKEAFREAVKQGVVSSSTKPQTLYDICMTWWERVFDNSDDMETCIDDLVDNIDYWLPTEHETNSYKWNECIRMIREKLR